MTLYLNQWISYQQGTSTAETGASVLGNKSCGTL